MGIIEVEVAVTEAMELEMTLDSLEATSEMADEAEAIIALTEVGLNVRLALANALEIAEVGIALGIKAAASVIKEVPFMTAKGVGIAVIPAEDKELCRAAIDEGKAVMFEEAKGLGKTD